MARCYTYILYSRKLDRFYIGVSVDVYRRLRHHNNRESGFTARGVPWQLLWYMPHVNLHEAESLERKLKHLTRVRKIRFMRKYSDNLLDSELLDSIIP
jgi:putative endonuclease